MMFSVCPFRLVAVFSIAMAGAAAAEEPILFLPSKPVPETDVRYVDTHDVIILDVSGSMDDSEIRAAVQGAADYYLSDRNISNYQIGVCAQSTVIFFGKEAFIGNSTVICSEQEAREFSNYILSENIEVIREIVGSNATNTGEGLVAAQVVFSDNQQSVTPLQYRVVVVGDELQVASEISVRNTSDSLIREFDAQVFGIAIGSEKVGDRFNDYMVSDREFFPAAVATNADDVRYQLNNYLRHTMG